MLALGYVRTSPSTDEEGEVTSIPNQKESIRSYEEENDIEVLEIFCDKDVSGRRVPPHEREGFSNLIEKVQDHREDDNKEPIEKIVVKDEDRFSRDEEVLNGVSYYKELHDFGDVEIIETEGMMSEALEEIDKVLDDMPDDSVEKKFLESAREDIKSKGMEIKQVKALITSAKTQNALNNKKERGEPVGKSGYGLTTDKVKFGKDEAKEYVPDDKEKDHFKRAISALNDIVYNDIDLDSDEGKTPYAVGRDSNLDASNYTTTVETIWRNRFLYWMVALEHRPDLHVELPDGVDEEDIKRKMEN